ncbi:MAG TPA: HAMP domain-containing histidine kinase [Clostridiaceae bacterium]|nr:HAMP domain-containing histidine kinase [Clostridiaceae bacterium]
MDIRNIKVITKKIRFKVFFSHLTVLVSLSGLYFFMNEEYTICEYKEIMIALTLFIVVILWIYFERKIVYPIIAFEKQITFMGKNNIIGKIYIDEPFEIVNLAKVFNEMSSKLEKKAREIAYLEDKLEHDKIRTEFFINLSHEIRTPLNVIFSTIQLFELYVKKGTFKDKDGKIAGSLNAVKQNCYRLIKLTNNMIDMAKLETNYYKINLKNVNIINIVRDITKSAAEYIAKKGKVIIFKTDLDEKIIACDTESIEKIILNLLSNAAKFTNAGGEIHVSVIDMGDFVSISVKDNGVGIPENKLDKIFERFIQVDRSLTRQHEGSGIGLFIVNSLVKMHGGKICVKSKPGEGSEFLVKLPVTLVQEEEKENETVNCNSCKGYMYKVAIEFSDIY